MHGMGKMWSRQMDKVMGQWLRCEVRARHAMMPAWRDMDEQEPRRGLKCEHIWDTVRE